MSESKHTPGPWNYRSASDNGEPCGYVVQSGISTIADVPQSEDDASLIAAAPDLLAVLEATLPWLPATIRHPIKMQVRAILAKAKGQS